MRRSCRLGLTLLVWLSDVVSVAGGSQKSMRSAPARSYAATVPPAALALLLGHCSLAVFTQGKAGACGVSASGEAFQVAAHDVKVVDTVGAGDSFCGAFLAAHMAGSPLRSCLRAGCAAGEAVVQCAGAHLFDEQWARLRQACIAAQIGTDDAT